MFVAEGWSLKTKIMNLVRIHCSEFSSQQSYRDHEPLPLSSLSKEMNPCKTLNSHIFNSAKFPPPARLGETGIGICKFIIVVFKEFGSGEHKHLIMDVIKFFAS